MTRKASKKKLKRQRREARRLAAASLQSRRSRVPASWIVAGAVVAATTLGRGEVLADPLPAKASASGAYAQTSTVQTERQFDIPAGPLRDVLRAYTALTGVMVTMAVDAIETIDSPGVSGRYNNERAMQAILAGTSVSYRFQSPGVVSIEFRGADQVVDVTGRAIAVASPKYSEPLREIPQTINVVSSRQMQEQGVFSLRDALRNVSGITFQAGEGGVPAGDSMTIRGFAAQTDLFIDGVRDLGGYARDTFNLEQVEVAKGPASAISGRGSTGGSINLVSKMPSVQESYGGALEVGNASFARSTIDFNQPIANGNAAVRFNAMWTDAGVPRRDEVKNKSWGVAPSIAIGLRGPTRVTLSYLHLGQDNIPDYGQPFVPATNVPLAAYAATGLPPVDPSNYYGLVARDHEEIDNNLGTATIDHQFTPTFTLRNITRYGQTLRDSVITAPRFATTTGTDVRRTGLQSRDQRDRIIANQTNLTNRFATGSLRHAIVAGLEFSREVSTNYVRAEFGPDTPISPNADLFNPNPNDRYTGQVRRTGAYNDGEANSAALYLFDTVELVRWLELSGGVRWDRFDVDYRSVAGTGIATPLARLDEVATWRAASIFKPRSNGSFYLGYATSFNPSAEGLALTAATVNIEPEKTRSFEGGTKWDLARLSTNAAIFRTEKTNARTPGINPGDPPTVLQGRQVVSGLELGMTGQITNRWMGVVNYAFLHSDIPRTNSPAELEQALQFTPEHTLSVWTTYDVWRTLRLGGGAQFMDAVFRNAANTLNLPSYWLVNAMASYNVNTHLTLRVNLNNLGNEEYVDRMRDGHFIPGVGRTLLVGTNLGF